jgi:cholinesterase
MMIEMSSRGLATAMGLCILATASSAAMARSWDALYAFGDSYSDSGAGYVDGNGPTAVAYLAQDLGIAFTYAGDPLAGAKSLNFAVSGAQTGKGAGVRMRPAAAPCGADEALLNRGMQTQVLDFTERVRTHSIVFEPGKTLFFIAGGLNDGSLPTAESIDNLKREVHALYDAGGRYFLIALLPTKIPGVARASERLNPSIAKLPAALRLELPEIQIGLSHWGAYFDRILEKPGEYGIVNTTDRCAGRALFSQDTMPCAAPDTYFYYHEAHPSTAVHRRVGAMLREEVLRVFP